MLRRLPSRVLRAAACSSLRIGASSRDRPPSTPSTIARLCSRMRTSAVRSSQDQSPAMYDSPAPTEPPNAVSA